MADKRYYWLKLHDDFFDSKRIKKLRKMAGGDTFTIIYLKMQLMAMKKGGVLKFSGLEEDFASELALDLDENEDNVKLTLAYLLRVGLAETSDNISFFFPYAVENTKSETASTQRSRKCRERRMLDAPKKEPKTIAERQSSFRAKQVCKENGHVPFIEDYVNNKRYNGNYYICFKRDKCQCVICGSNQNLCMHHIDGYDENKPENSCANKMITLCRDCHIKVHRSGTEIPKDILESINYFDEDVTSNEFCNATATELQRRDRDIEIDKDIEIDNPPIIPPKGKRSDEYDSLFDRFWKSYPRKVAKENARKAFAKLKPNDELLNAMLSAIEKQKKSEQWTKDGGQFIPHPATWLNQHRWEDEMQTNDSICNFDPNEAYDLRLKRTYGGMV